MLLEGIIIPIICNFWFGIRPNILAKVNCWDIIIPYPFQSYPSFPLCTLTPSLFQFLLSVLPVNNIQSEIDSVVNPNIVLTDSTQVGGQPIQLEDGTTAFLHHTPKGLSSVIFTLPYCDQFH